MSGFGRLGRKPAFVSPVHGFPKPRQITPIEEDAPILEEPTIRDTQEFETQLPEEDDESMSGPDDEQDLDAKIEEVVREETRMWLNEYAAKQFQLAVNQYLVKKEKKEKAAALDRPKKKKSSSEV